MKRFVKIVATENSLVDATAIGDVDADNGGVQIVCRDQGQIIVDSNLIAANRQVENHGAEGHQQQFLSIEATNHSMVIFASPEQPRPFAHQQMLAAGPEGRGENAANTNSGPPATNLAEEARLLLRAAETAAGETNQVAVLIEAARQVVQRQKQDREQDGL